MQRVQRSLKAQRVQRSTKGAVTKGAADAAVPTSVTSEEERHTRKALRVRLVLNSWAVPTSVF